MKGRKLDSPLKYRHLAKVTLRPFTQFPIDMLRYDNARAMAPCASAGCIAMTTSGD